MRYKRYSDVNIFLRECGDFLYEKEIENNVIIGLCTGILAGESRFKEYHMFSVSEDGNMKAVAMITPPLNLLIDDRGEKYLYYLLENIVEEKIQIPGVVGECNSANRAMEYLSCIYKMDYKRIMGMKVFKLEKVNDSLKEPKGNFIKVDMKYHKLITRWMYEAEIDFGFGERGKEIYTEKRLNRAKLRIENDRTFIWVDENKNPVTMAMIPRNTENVGVVGMVYTPKEYRRKGYATACVKRLSQRILDSGSKYASLFTDITNPTSNSIYMKIGYVPIGDCLHLEFKKKD